MDNYEWTDDMNEISGYGGSYERACRTMVIAGATWCADHPYVTPLFSGYIGVPGSVEPMNGAALALREAIQGAQFVMDDGRKVRMGDEMTEAMYYGVIHHILYIAHHGWNLYREKMSAPVALFGGDDEATEGTDESSL